MTHEDYQARWTATAGALEALRAALEQHWTIVHDEDAGAIVERPCDRIGDLCHELDLVRARLDETTRYWLSYPEPDPEPITDEGPESERSTERWLESLGYREEP